MAGLIDSLEFQHTRSRAPSHFHFEQSQNIKGRHGRSRLSGKPKQHGSVETDLIVWMMYEQAPQQGSGPRGLVEDSGLFDW